MKGSQPKQWLFSVSPATDRGDLVVSYGSTNTESLAYGFVEAAERLAGTATGAAIDDVILVPYLQLMRHSYELALKSAIHRLAKTYRTYIYDLDPDWSCRSVERRLRSKALGHRLLPLYREFERTWSLFPGVMPPAPDIKQKVEMLHQVDPSGQSLRYAASIHAEQQYASFGSLHEVLTVGLNALNSSVDYIVEGHAGAPTLSELR